MVDPPFDRITALIQLAASDNENEARSAAQEACRLIRFHGLVVRRSFEDACQAFKREGRPAATTVGIPIVDLRQSSPRKPLQVDKKRMRPVVMASPATTPIQMKAKFMGRCEDCGGAYAQGEPIWYRRGVGAVHDRCEPEALV